MSAGHMGSGEKMRAGTERVGSLIRIGLDVWEVQAIYLGALGQESVIHVRRLGAKDSHEGPSLVPAKMLRTMYVHGTASLYHPWVEGPCPDLYPARATPTTENPA